MKLIKKQINIAVRNDQYPHLPVIRTFKKIKYSYLEHPAFVEPSGIYAIHKSLEKPKLYTITHIPTGMQVGPHFEKLFEASDRLESSLFKFPEATLETDSNPTHCHKSKSLLSFSKILHNID